MTEPAKIVKASSSVVSAARRRSLFAERYLVNGNNATDAATFAGLSAKTAYSSGQRLLNHPEVKALVAGRTAQVMVDAQLTTERWAKEMACIAHFDPSELYDKAGDLIPIHKLPEHVRRAISSVERDKYGTKVKTWDKNAALANVGKHLGMFERDNHQKSEGIKVLVQLLG